MAIVDNFLKLTLCIILISCSKEEIKEDLTLNSFDEIFESFWNSINNNYVYWDVDTTNWDHVYKKYKPLFNKMDLNNNQDIIKSVDYFQNMTKNLIDGHFYLSFNNPLLSSYFSYPSLNRKETQPNFHLSYLFHSIDTAYLDDDFSLGFDYENTYNTIPLTILEGTINKEILFLSCSNFSLMKSYFSQNENTAQKALKLFFDKINNPSQRIRGLIIDVRGNSGGDISDLNFLVGQLIDKPLHFGYIQSKSGNGRLDFTPWVKAYVNPQQNAKTLKVPIVVLADLNSASLSEIVVMAVKSIPNSVFIGETTWGGTGPITDYEVYNDGQFVTGNYLKVLTSSCKFKYIDNKIYEGIGFSPDVYESFNIIEYSKGVDNQLLKAINFLESSF